MSDTKAASGGMQAAIERSGYYPGLVYDAVSSAVGHEDVVSYFVLHDAHFDPGMEVRRHVTVMALTPTRLVYSHTDEYPADDADPESRPQAETSTEAVHCGDENCEADHGFTGTMTADDLTVRVSEAADGPEAVDQVVSFARAL